MPSMVAACVHSHNRQVRSRLNLFLTFSAFLFFRYHLLYRGKQSKRQKHGHAIESAAKVESLPVCYSSLNNLSWSRLWLWT